MRILFIAMSESIHTARWINQITDRGWDVHLFPAYPAPTSPELKNVTLYGLPLFRTRNADASVRYIGFLPIGRAGNIFDKAIHHFYPKVYGFFLRMVVKLIKPDIIHSLEFQHGAALTLPVVRRERIKRGRKFKWVITNWGSDIFLFGKLPESRDLVHDVLSECDFYSCECERDVALAKELGLKGEVLPVVPNTGGFDLQRVAAFRQPGPTSQRRTILLKGYQHWAGRALVGLRALARCADLLNAGHYNLAIYSASPDVRLAAQLFQSETGIETVLIPQTKHDEILTWFGKARIYLGLSISDAISTSLLEAMVMGTFPIQSCTSCANEWIEHGKSGFIVPPEDPDIIEAFIREALQQDELVDGAAFLNRETAQRRLASNIIHKDVAAFYEQVIHSSEGIEK